MDPAYLFNKKVIKKSCVARGKGYIDLGIVDFLTSFSKGLTDIRMVYNGTKSRLDKMLWAPWFHSLLQRMEPGTWMADNNVREMFLYFILHVSVQALCGVDLTKCFPEGIPEGIQALWERYFLILKIPWCPGKEVWQFQSLPVWRRWALVFQLEFVSKVPRSWCQGYDGVLAGVNFHSLIPFVLETISLYLWVRRHKQGWVWGITRNWRHQGLAERWLDFDHARRIV